jgi:hypothetical protein
MVWWSGLLNLNNHSTRDAESSSADPARASQEPRLADVVSLIAGMHSRAPKTQGKMTGMHRRSLRARRASRCSKRLRASRNVWGEIAGACDLCRRNAVSALSEFRVPDVSLSIIPSVSALYLPPSSSSADVKWRIEALDRKVDGDIHHPPHQITLLDHSNPPVKTL